MEETGYKDCFTVSGRGILHLSILIEQMRREGYEISIGKPEVIRKKIDGKWHEPFERLVIDVPTADVGPVMELAGNRRARILDMVADDTGITHLAFSIPARGLIGLRTRMLHATRGEAVINHRFDCYKPVEGETPRRKTGVLVSQVNGFAVGYALWKLQERAEMFVNPGDVVYEGMIVGENSRENDMVVNPIREKKLTNIRSSGADDAILLKPPRAMSLEAALEYIESDEYVEVTPYSRVVFTWGWEGEGNPVPPGSSTVEITLVPDGDGTVVRLRHHGLSAQEGAKHAEGWAHYLDRLVAAGEGRDPGADPWAS